MQRLRPSARGPNLLLVRRSLALAVAALAAAPEPAGAQDGTGGAEYVPAPWVAARAFSVTPASIAPGAVVTLRYRIAAQARRVRVRVDLLPEGGGRPAATLRLGPQRTRRTLRANWRPRLEPGRYVARLRATAVRSRRRARASRTEAFEVVAPPVVAASGVFPVRGPYSLGGDGARFGAPRSSHSHRGQDIVAGAGTAVVSPRAGSVTWRAYQAGGAGHYLVVHGDDGRDYVFMHLQDGSLAVEQGDAVAAGQRLGAVGATGRADGPHLHFEIWPDGWYAGGGSAPIDPLPDLLAWAGR